MPYETLLGVPYFPLLIKPIIIHSNHKISETLSYITYRLLLMQNLIIPLHYFGKTLSPIYHSKKSKNMYYLSSKI